MRDIYLIDFENVASEGLSGITYLSPEDQVIIFYSANSNRLSMKMHILIGKSTCNLSYFEVSVGGKNALDHQISTWLGYLIGTGAAERSYYIVSRDMGYRHVANFWAVNDGKPRVKCVETIRAAVRLERIRQEKEAAAEHVQAPEAEKEMPVAVAVPEVPVPVPTPEMLRAVTEPVLELKAAEIQAETLLEAEPEAPAVSAEPAEVISTEPEPLESLDDPEPGSNRKSYRGRTRFRRNRGKSHAGQDAGKAGRENELEQPKEEKNNAVEKAEEKPAAPEKKPEEKLPEKKPEIQPEKPTAPKREEKPASSERYSSSFWQKPRPEPKPEPVQEKQPVEPKSEKSQEKKPEKMPDTKPNGKELQKPEKKSEPKPEPKTEQKQEKKQESKQHNKPQQKRSSGEKPRKAPAAKQDGPNLEQLPRLLAPYPQLQENTLKELIVANKRQVLCNTLRKQLGQEKGLALYNELKKTVWK